MSEIVARLREAIDETERTIDAYEQHRADPAACRNYVGQAVDVYDPYDSCYLHVETSKAMPYSDPAYGRRRVAADRKLLAEYEQIDEILDGDKYPESWTCGQHDAWEAAIAILAEGYGIQEVEA